MKKLLYTLSLVLTLASCRSIEKMVERGEYDRAIHHAAEKLAGKKNKKTEHVQGLEEAFYKINERDLDQIAYLDGPNSPFNWKKIHDIADKIQRRQNKITPFLPLISKEGYVGTFEMVDVHAIKLKATQSAADFYYKEGLELLRLSKEKSKKVYARNAYRKFSEANKLVSGQENIHGLLSEAKELGAVNILVAVENNSASYLPARVMNNLENLNLQSADDIWRRFHTQDDSKVEFDYKAVLQIMDVQLSSEREIISYHTDEAKIKDGKIAKLDRNGVPVKDTSGNIIKVQKYRTVYADVTEIQREKSAKIHGLLSYVDLVNGTGNSSNEMTFEAIFSDYSSSYRGDSRALCGRHSKMKSRPYAFPNDADLIVEAAENLKYDFLNELSHFRI